MTIRQARERAGIPLQTEDFISSPVCHKSKLHMPFPTVPTHLMEEGAAQKARAALDACTGIVGIYGDAISRRNTPEFKAAAEAFSQATGGVPAWCVIELARELFLNS